MGVTQRRCQGCAHFYDKALKNCPSCGVPKYAHNEGLLAARWASNLNAQAARARNG